VLLRSAADGIERIDLATPASEVVLDELASRGHTFLSPRDFEVRAARTARSRGDDVVSSPAAIAFTQRSLVVRVLGNN